MCMCYISDWGVEISGFFNGSAVEQNNPCSVFEHALVLKRLPGHIEDYDSVSSCGFEVEVYYCHSKYQL